MLPYYACLEKTVKWCTKIIICLVCETCHIDVSYINKMWAYKHINILKLRKQIIDHLLINNPHTEKIAIWG